MKSIQVRHKQKHQKTLANYDIFVEYHGEATWLHGISTRNHNKTKSHTPLSTNPEQPKPRNQTDNQPKPVFPVNPKTTTNKQDQTLKAHYLRGTQGLPTKIADPNSHPIFARVHGRTTWVHEVLNMEQHFLQISNAP